jgi:hypothetical protein
MQVMQRYIAGPTFISRKAEEMWSVSPFPNKIAVMTGIRRTVSQSEVKVHNSTALIHASLDVPRALNQNQLRIPNAILPITGVLLQVIHIALAPE